MTKDQVLRKGWWTPRSQGDFGGPGVEKKQPTAASLKARVSPKHPFSRPLPGPVTLRGRQARSAGRGPSATLLAPKKRWDFPHRK